MTENNERTEVRRTISPYDLTAADNSGAIISYPLLKANNYDEWTCSMKTALLSRKKFGFLDGTIPKPSTDSSDFEDWQSINALLVSWIKMSIDPGLKSNISHRENARDLWEHLRKRFAVSNGPRNQKMKADLASCKQQGMTVEGYFGKLMKIWENVNNYRPVRVCECGKCVCNLGQKQEKDREDDMVQQFLWGLDEKVFHAVRLSLTTRVPLPSLEEAYNNVCQEEDMFNNSTTREEKPEITAFAVQTKTKFRSDDREKTSVCKHCNRGGHYSDNCFLVVGYPEWWGDQPRSRVQPHGNSTRGRGRGGSSYNGGQQRNGVGYANAVNTVSSSPLERVNQVITDRDRDAVSGLTDEQWRGVVNLLNASRQTTAAQAKPNSTETLSRPHYEDGDWSW